MGDDNGTHLGVGQKLAASNRQGGPHGKRHVLAVDLRHLLDLQRPLCGLRQSGYRIEQILHAHLARHIANVVAGGLCLARNGAPCAQNNDFSCAHLHPPKNWLKIQLLD